MRAIIVLGVVLAALGLGVRPGQAAGAAPWCAVFSLGWGDTVWDCSYPSLEACRPNVIAGNRGFCNPNPAWDEPTRAAPHRKHPVPRG